MTLQLPHTSLDDILAAALAGEVTPTGDVTFAAGKGPVVHDDADGHTYRIGTHNGTLTVTQVS